MNKIKEYIIKNKRNSIIIGITGVLVITLATLLTVFALNNNKKVESLNNKVSSSSSISSETTSSEIGSSTSEESSSSETSSSEVETTSSEVTSNSPTQQPPVITPKPPVVNNNTTQNKPSNPPPPVTNTTPPAQPPVIQPPKPAERTWEYMPSLSRQTFDLMNSFRQQNGVSPLKWNETCNQRAVAQAKYNAESNTHGHGTGQISLGNGTANPQAYINQWANSEGHKASMLRETDTDGAVAVYKDSTGAYFVVADKTNDFWG